MMAQAFLHSTRKIWVMEEGGDFESGSVLGQITSKGRPNTKYYYWYVKDRSGERGGKEWRLLTSTQARRRNVQQAVRHGPIYKSSHRKKDEIN